MRRIPALPLGLLCLALVGAAPAKEKKISPARKAATARSTELSQALIKSKVSGFVVLGRHAAPSEQAARALAAPPAGALAVDTSGLRGSRVGTVWKVLADRGDVVQVESLPRQGAEHCHPGGAESPVTVRAFARKADILPIVTSEISETFADGTSIAFAPGAVVGAPLVPRRRGWAVVAEGIVREMRVAPGHMALSYPAPKPFGFKRQRHAAWRISPDATPEPPAFREVARGAVAYLDGAAAIRGAQLSEPLREVQASAEPNGANAPAPELLELASPCLKMKVLATSAPGDTRGAGGIGALGGRRPRVYAIPKGAPLVYPDGAVAGATLAEMRWEDPQELGARICATLAVAVESPLCVAKGAASEVER